MFLPLYFKTGLSCLLVGGGRVASHKIRILTEMPCNLTVIAPQVTDYVEAEVREHSIRWKRREYIEGDCEGYQLVIAATPSREVNRRISEEAQKHGIPVNVVDDPELSTVIFPAVWREKSLSIAVSTDGAAPFMAAEIRTQLARFAEGLGEWVETGGRFRETVKQEVAETGKRNALYRKFLDAGRPEKGSDPPPRTATLNDWMQWLECIEKNQK
jgi:uroporphyrin-III C-methyltransferase / precorrin-2 dehydrogenase / sirohydrochlorin ferrochelatase